MIKALFGCNASSGELMTSFTAPRQSQRTSLLEQPIVFVIDDDVSVREALAPLISSVWVERGNVWIGRGFFAPCNGRCATLSGPRRRTARSQWTGSPETSHRRQEH